MSDMTTTGVRPGGPGGPGGPGAPGGRHRHYRDFEDAMSRGHHHDALAYIVEVLSALDHGEHVTLDFLGRRDVGRFCRMIGIGRNWAELTIDAIAPKGARGPHEVPQAEADVLLTGLTRLIDANVFSPKDGSTFDPAVLNDFLPAGTTFHGKPCRGNAWEFAYGLAVELEHGRTFGANVTNNHPALTAMIVMGHVLEDRLYYARLWVMEVEGELHKAREGGATPAELAPIENELREAQAYLAQRVAQP